MKHALGIRAVRLIDQTLVERLMRLTIVETSNRSLARLAAALPSACLSSRFRKRDIIERENP